MIKLYQHSFLRVYSFSLAMGLLWFSFILQITSNINDNGFFGAAFIGLISPLLSFVFLLRLPNGRWWQQLAFELAMLVAGMGLVILLYLYISNLLYARLQERLVPEAFYIMMVVSAFSHLAVRIFARPYSFWQAIRHKRLVWEITHAQLRFILLGFLLVFIAVMLFAFASMLQFYPITDYTIWIVNALSLTIIYGGFLGILTGILLLILVFPAIAISYFTARRITNRLDKLIAASAAIRAGHYETRLTVEGEDEVASLQTNFNAMAQELETALNHLKSERDSVASLLESRRRLFANISHELRTPLATIRLSLEQASKETTNSSLETMQQEVLRLQHLMDDVFLLVQSDNQQLRYSLKPENPIPVLQQLVSMLKPQAWQSKKVDILLECPDTLPLIRVDRERFEQILLNLLRNAIRHTPPGGLIVLRASARESQVCFEVCDTGEGIAEADLPYIWERFYRAEQSQMLEPQGLGLGLALVKEMLEAMNGSINVDSVPNEGTCFRFHLPICDNFATDS